MAADSRAWKGYLVFIFLIPLPFGLNTPWAWPLAGAVVFLLLFLKLRSLTTQTTENHSLTELMPVPLTKALPFILILTAVQLWGFIQLLTPISLSPYDTRMYLFKGVSYSAFFALTLLFLNSPKRVESLITVMMISAAAQGFYGVFMVLSDIEWGFLSPKTAYLGNATGTYVNRNHLAGYLEMTLAFGVGYLLSRSTSVSGNFRQKARAILKIINSRKTIIRMMLIIGVIALVMTRSRMGNTAFFISLSVTGALALLLLRNKTRSTSILLISLLVIDVLIVGTFFGMDKVIERLESTSAQVESRDEVALDVLERIKQSPLTGIGAGAFTYSFPAFKHEHVTTAKIYNHAHNDYAQFALEFGIPASLCLLYIVLKCLWWAVDTMRQRRSQFFQGVGFGATMAIIAIGIHSTVDFNLQIPANAFTLMLVLALACTARWLPRDKSSS